MKNALLISCVRVSLLAAAALCAGAEPVLNEDNSWAFEAKHDDFRDDALLDLRRLNEARSGQTGLIRLSEDGMSFVRGNRQPIRFWGVASNPNVRWTPEQIDDHFRFLAKRGVNLVRMHCHIADESPGAEITDIDEKERDTIWRYVAAAKENGIYILISPYWYHRKIPASWKLEGYKAGDMPVGSLYVSRRYIEAYKTWLRKLYLPRNPYTGLALKDDPTLAICKFKNEDGLLWYTFDKIAEPHKTELRKRFATWLTEKYGSTDKALRAWDEAKAPDDDWSRGLPGFYITWDFTQSQRGAKARRMADELAFRASLQRAWYAEIHQFHRQQLGMKQLTTPNSWRGADPRALGDVERWTCTVCNVITDNRYTGGLHQGPRRGYMISRGDRLANWSMTRKPLELPVNVKQVVGHPFILTETAWANPNRYQSEGPFMTAAYMSLTGVDSACWFHPSAPQWDADPRFPFGDKPWKKWTGSLPGQMDMFPASALMFRQAMLAQGRPVVVERRAMGEMFARRDPAIAESQLFDPIQDEKDLRGGQVSQASNLAFLVGPVHVEYSAEGGEDQLSDLREFVDPGSDTVTSNTGQIRLDYGRGLFTVDAPRAKGVAGFLAEAGGSFQLDGLTVRSENDYAAVQVVSMDREPLARSGKVLIQVGTWVRMTGWATRDARIKHRDHEVEGLEITRIGRPPLRIANTRVSIMIDNPGLSKATLLNHNGYAVSKIPVRREGGKLTIDLPERAVYVVLR